MILEILSKSWNQKDALYGLTVGRAAGASKNMRMLILFAALGAGFLTGCASNPFTQFYQSYTNQLSVTEQQRFLPSVANPQVMNVQPQNYHGEGRRLQERYFICIGSASFRGGVPTQKQLVEQAKTVGADVVVFASQYSHTEQGVMPMLNYQPGQTYNTTEYGTANASVYGSGGYASGSATYSGHSTTTTPGTFDTQYVPYQRQVYDYGASFWRRIKPGHLGARLVPIPEGMRADLQRNTGALVEIVMFDSPAFRANILEGDIIIQMADKPIATVQDVMEMLPSYAGKKVTFKIMRHGLAMDIEVRLRENQ